MSTPANNVIKVIRLANGGTLLTATGQALATSPTLTIQEATESKYMAVMISCVNTPVGGTSLDVALEVAKDQATDANSKWETLSLQIDGEQATSNPSATADVNRVRFLLAAKDYVYFRIPLPGFITKIRANVTAVSGVYSTGVGLQVVGTLYN